MEEVEGIILKESPYKENSKILQILTKEHGIIGVIAKGVKKPNSKLRAFSIRFTYGVFQISYKENKLSTLINADVKDSLETIKSDILLISYLGYLSELTLQVIKHEYNSDIYEMFITSILKINAGLDPLIIANILELKYLPYLGVGISLDSCVKCGKTTDIVTIDGDAGGLICKNCYTNELLVDLKTIKLIRMYYLVDIKSITEINIGDKIKREINMFIEKFHHEM